MTQKCPCCQRPLDDSIYGQLSLLRLRPTEFRIATLLAKQFGIYVPRHQLAERLGTSIDAIKVHVCHIRFAIDQTDLKIETRQGLGYRLARRAVQEAA